MRKGMCIAFHGGDHKTGVTMLCQCVMEHMAEHLENETVLQTALHGYPGGDYSQAMVQSVEGMRSYLDQQLLNSQELLRECKIQENGYLMWGIFRPEQQRFYHPKTAGYLLEELRRELSFMILDTGSEADNGLAIGALQSADVRCLVLTQQESVLSRWERYQGIYRRLGMDFHYIVINRYLPEAAYTKEYMADRLGFPVDRILTVADSPYGLRADGEKKSLLQYRDERVRQGVRGICERLTERCGIDYPKEKRWKRWKSSI